VLKVSHLSKSFGTTHAVRDVSFEIPRGSAFGLLGPNGAGKTTTISMIVGALLPDGGQIELDGKPIGPDAKQHLGFVPQELALYEDLSAKANLSFFGSLYHHHDPEAQRSVLELVGLTDRADEPVKQYSGGMKRRLNIAIGLIHGPDFLVLDEPTVGVDPQSRNAIFETLERLREKGVTLLYTTHYMEEVERLCDRVAIMDHGAIIAEDRIENLHNLMPVRKRVTLEISDCGPAIEIPGTILEGRKLHIDVADLSTDLPPMLAAVTKAGMDYTSVSSHRASLEEIFLHLTGRNLRD
jgi:ABC-2 type transport system ATP-binding protein